MGDTDCTIMASPRLNLGHLAGADSSINTDSGTRIRKMGRSQKGSPPRFNVHITPEFNNRERRNGDLDPDPLVVPPFRIENQWQGQPDPWMSRLGSTEI